MAFALPKVAVDGYVTRGALAGLAKATVGVTVTSNVFSHLYAGYAGTDPSQAISNTLGVLLSFALVLFFAKREKTLTKPQYGLLLLVNTAILFHSSLGANTALSALKRGMDDDTAPSGEATHTAGWFGLEYLLLPSAPWISPDLPEKVRLQTELNEVKEEVSSLVVLDTIHTHIDILVREQQRNNDHMRALNLELDTVRSRYQRSLEENQAQAAVFATRLEELRVNIRTNPAEAMQGATELHHVVLEQQQVQEDLQQQVQQQIVDQREQQVQQQQQQVQQQQQQQLLQQQVQQQQQQLVRVRKRLFLN